MGMEINYSSAAFEVFRAITSNYFEDVMELGGCGNDNLMEIGTSKRANEYLMSSAAIILTEKLLNGQLTSKDYISLRNEVLMILESIINISNTDTDLTAAE